MSRTVSPNADRKVYEDRTYWNPFWVSPAHFGEQIAPTSMGKGTWPLA